MLAFYFLYVFINNISNVMIFNCYFDKKNNLSSRNKSIILAIISFANAAVIYQFNHSVINLLLTALITFFNCFVFFTGKTEVQVLVSVIILFFDMVLDVLTTLSANAILKLSMEISGVRPLVIVITAIPFCFCKLMITKTIRRNRVKTAYVGDRDAYSKQLVIPACSIIFIIYYIYTEINTADFQLSEIYITIFFLAGVNLIHHIIFENNEKFHLENYNNVLLQQNYKHREEYYKNLEKHQEEIRIMKHDLKNQLIRLTGYDDCQAKKEIELMADSLGKKDEVHFTRNVGINALLGVKYNDAKKREIQCDFSILIPEKVGINEMDLTGLAGNIVDNAIEAAERCQNNKWIKFYMFYYNQMLTIRCENSTIGIVKDFTTTKKRMGEHGLGLKSIHHIVEMYHGDYEYKAEDDSLILEVNLWSSEKNMTRKSGN